MWGSSVRQSACDRILSGWNLRKCLYSAREHATCTRARYLTSSRRGRVRRKNCRKVTFLQFSLQSRAFSPLVLICLSPFLFSLRRPYLLSRSLAQILYRVSHKSTFLLGQTKGREQEDLWDTRYAMNAPRRVVIPRERFSILLYVVKVAPKVSPPFDLWCVS